MSDGSFSLTSSRENCPEDMSTRRYGGRALDTSRPMQGSWAAPSNAFRKGRGDRTSRPYSRAYRLMGASSFFPSTTRKRETWHFAGCRLRGFAVIYHLCASATMAGR
jgi:hypothetical protein